MRRFFFDAHRALLLLLTAIRWGAAPAARYALGLRPGPLSVGVRLRRFIEGMGITYNKVGQYLAMRFDILPPEVCQELGRLFEGVAPMHMQVVRKQIEAELGGPVSRFFARFETEPVGSASVAQVHRAITRDGVTVAVKVQRPGVAETFLADMRNLRRVAWLVDRIGVLGTISVAKMVDEIEDFTLREMDFLTEGRTADRLRAGSSVYAYVPQVRWDLTTRRVLTMEFIKGVSLLAVCELAERGGRVERLLPGIDLTRVIGDLARACLHQLFVTGFFQGDPHPGNILIREDGAVVFVDFGIFGELTDEERRLFGDYIENLALGNIEESFRCYLRLVTPTPDTDMEGYRRETIEILSKWYAASKDPSAPREERHTGKYQGQMVSVMRRYHVRMRPNQLLFWRVMAVLDATALRLPVQFELISTMEGFFRRTRPGLHERVAALLADPRPALSAADLWRDFGRRALGVPGRAAAEKLTVRARLNRYYKVRRGGRSAPGWLSLSLVALSLSLALGAQPWRADVALLAAAAGLIVFASLVSGVRS